ncbi:MAG: Cys-Xaa-Xaa-Xaa repeat radical SAM target protein [Bacteroidales bacterium]|nr:Cys-Xaa-Xaa-Xaa repeat radical SAM target protein [Bacteroidales bacterium]MBR6930432.1 Cys-Xaa-Xaa-Xaa repeat radical SAM target protein [Bacteroidales bacterium]
MENNKNNETQNRREFFKEAARKALPILGAVALMSNPLIAKVLEHKVTGCETNCSGSCKGTCAGKCDGCCAENGCKGTCSGTCNKSCSNSTK